MTKTVAPMNAAPDPEWMCETVAQWILSATSTK